MLTKNYAKLIHSLANKKFRQKYNLFVVEGIKNVNEVLNSNFQVEKLFFTEGNWSEKFDKSTQISETELKQISQLKTPNQVLVTVKIPEQKTFEKTRGITIVLDDIRDPGNLGTILRLADWFGIQQIVCSNKSVDLYNTKCVQASMGSIFRVKVYYEDLNSILKNSNSPTIGTFMNGKNLYEQDLPENCYLVFGNEANGISKTVEQNCDIRLAIPQFGKSQNTESLNIAMATAITLGEFKGRKFK